MSCGDLSRQLLGSPEQSLAANPKWNTPQVHLSVLTPFTLYVPLLNDNKLVAKWSGADGPQAN